MGQGGPLRVLVISHLFPHAGNPALGCFVHEQVLALRRFGGVDARVVCGRPCWINSINPWRLLQAYRDYRRRFRGLRWQEWQGVPVLYVPYLAGGFFRFWLHGSTYRAAVMRAAPWIRRSFTFDLVHAHTSYLDGGAAWLLGRRLGVPYVVTEHTNPFGDLMNNRLIRRQTLGALPDARQVWCVSSSLAAEVRSWLPASVQSRVAVLANGVDTAAFSRPACWTPDPAAPRLLSVTALEPYKNPLLLLRAFRRLHDQVPGARLALVAAGPLETEARAFVAACGLQSSVAFLGRQPRAEVARLMREECDLFVLSSDSETFGVVLIEALASGKPVVATDCGGPRDVITDPGLGILCPPRDETALANALLAAVRRLPAFDPRHLRRQAERFDFAGLAGRLAHAYRELLGCAQPCAQEAA